MSFLFGSAPQATFNTQPTTSPNQQGLLAILTQLLSGTPGTTQPAQGTFAAPVTGPQGAILSDLSNQANNPNPNQLNLATGALNSALTGLGTASNYQAPQIDATQAFQQGVVQPLTQNFNQNVLPGIAGQFGASAGGATNSGSLMARQTAGQNLDTTLADVGSQYSLGAAQANQGADLTANAQRIAALSATPGVAQSASTIGGTTSASNVAPLLAILQGLGLPQQTAQTQISGSYGNAQSSLADLIAAFSPATQQTLGVGTGGTTGLIQSLLGGLASNAGVGNALTGLFGGNSSSLFNPGGV
jgi:hypothetical protein